MKSNPINCSQVRIVFSALVLLGVSSTTFASEKHTLDVNQLDSISAGLTMLAARAEGTANALSDSAAIAGVRTDTDAASRVSGGYRVDRVAASGISYACCDGGETTLDVEVSSDAEQQYGITRVYSFDSSLVSVKIGVAGIVGVSRL